MMYEEEQEDAFMAQNQSLEVEFMGSGNSLGASLSQSLAFELQSATLPEVSKSTQSQRKSKSSASPMTNGKQFPNSQDDNPLEIELEVNGMKLEVFGSNKQPELPIGVSHSLADEIFTISNSNAPSPSPSISAKALFQNGSDQEDIGGSFSSQPHGDTVEFLKVQLDHLNAAVTETKTLHKRIIDSLLSDENFHLSRSLVSSSAANSSSFAPPLELVISSVANLMDRKARDRERHLTILRNIEKDLRVDGLWLASEVLDEVDAYMLSMSNIMTDSTMAYQNLVPTIHELLRDSVSLSNTLEDLKEQMYVHKRQGQELSTRMKHIAKAAHEARKELRETSEQAGLSSDEEVTVLQEGEVKVRVGEILGGLDELDQRSSQEIQKMMGWWRGDGSTAVGVTS